METETLINGIEGFDWDLGNEVKNLLKHRVECKECEEVFFNEPRLTDVDKKHSVSEIRLKILGRTDRDRRLFVVFTIRNKKIRIISARDQNRKEKLKYSNFL